MARSNKAGTASPTCQLLRSQDEDFWNAVQVYPEVIRKGAAKDYRAQALTRLKKCGINNLRLLLERATLANPVDATPDQAAASLLAADKSSTLQCLADFVRGKGRAILEEYDDFFSPAKRRSHVTQLEELAQGKKGTLKQFVKLMLLYEESGSSIERVFARKLWRGRRTTCEFSTGSKFSAAARKKIEADTKSLADAVADAFNGLELRATNTVKLGSWDILLFQREYAASVRPDYRETQKTVYGLGWMLLGIERGGRRVLLKGGGKKAIPLIQSWFEHKIKCQLVAAESDAFQDYDADFVENALLGRYPDDSPIELVGMSFRRTLLPQHSPLTLHAPFPGHSIRQDLNYGRENSLFRVRALSDIASFRLAFDGTECSVQVDVETGGGVVLRLDDTDLSESQVSELRTAFERFFGVPLDRRIDPQNLLLGAVDVYNCLLESDRTAGLASYQLKALNELVRQGILEKVDDEVLVCPKQPFVCKLGGKPVKDEDIGECPECQAELEIKTITHLHHNDKEIRRKAGALLAKATGWKFSTKGINFEKERFFPLSDPKRPDRQIRVYFAKRVGARLLERLDRSLQPVLVVHTGGDVEHAHLDAADVAHMSFARALAARVDKEVLKRFNADAKSARDELVQKREQLVYRRASRSRSRLKEPTADYLGADFEVDVFNLLRSIFPYTEFWTGTNRPDGFCSLVYYENNNLRNVSKCNWSYDAKFTRDAAGYDLDVGEERKIWDYVAGLAKQPELQTTGNQYDGHAIISNNVSSQQKAKVAAFVRREHRLGKKYPDAKVVFIDLPFLTGIYDSVMSNFEVYRTRWPYLSKKLTEMLSNENSDNYVQLGAEEAASLWKWVSDRSPIDNPPDMHLLKSDLDQSMTKS